MLFLTVSSVMIDLAQVVSLLEYYAGHPGGEFDVDHKLGGDLMSEEAFRSELRRMASANGIAFLKEDKIIDLLRSEMKSGARFINVFQGHEKSALLLVTSVATHFAKSKMFSVRLVWSVRHDELRSVRPHRHTFQGYVIDDLQLSGNNATREFRFGFNAPRYDTETQREIAEHNCQTAAAQVSDARSSAVPGKPTASLQVPDELAQRARIRYGSSDFMAAAELYSQAVDKLHTMYVVGECKYRRPSELDIPVMEGLVSAVGAALAMDSNAPVRPLAEQSIGYLSQIIELPQASPAAHAYEFAIRELATILRRN